MRESALREVVLVKAIEEADRAGALLPLGERERAAREALRSAGVGSGEAARRPLSAAVERALADRAAQLAQPQHARHPVLWDTPGCGDSVRLLRRLRQSGNPLGWFLTQAWDRFIDRPFFSSQLAVRNVRDEADVVLYLVNAGEDPAGAGYVGPC